MRGLDALGASNEELTGKYKAGPLASAPGDRVFCRGFLIKSKSETLPAAGGGGGGGGG
eukprot:COSAG02_NODE_55412_length_290_cov_1.649215_1_plen_57_part_01